MEHKKHQIKNDLRKCFREKFKSPISQNDCLNLTYDTVDTGESISILPET